MSFRPNRRKTPDRGRITCAEDISYKNKKSKKIYPDMTERKKVLSTFKTNYLEGKPQYNFHQGFSVQLDAFYTVGMQLHFFISKYYLAANSFFLMLCVCVGGGAQLILQLNNKTRGRRFPHRCHNKWGFDLERWA